MKKATIYDYVRMCNNTKSCKICPLDAFRNSSNSCFGEMIDNTEKVNEIILKWCKEHPVKTRQDKFLEMFPNAHIYTDGALEVQPCHINENIVCKREDDCNVCRSKYWLAEVEE